MAVVTLKGKGRTQASVEHRAWKSGVPGKRPNKARSTCAGPQDESKEATKAGLIRAGPMRAKRPSVQDPEHRVRLSTAKQSHPSGSSPASLPPASHS